MQAPSGKAVLVCFGDNRRVFTIPPSSERTVSERESLLALCRSEFRELMPADTCTLTLQVKDEDWGGIYVDYTESHVEDRSKFQLVAVPQVVSYFIITKSSLLRKNSVQAKVRSSSTSQTQDSVICSPSSALHSVICSPVRSSTSLQKAGVRPKVKKLVLSMTGFGYSEIIIRAMPVLKKFLKSSVVYTV